MAKTPRFILSFEALIEAPSAGMAEAQRQAMKNALGNPMIKTFLEQLGVKLVGYRVHDEVKPVGK
jgi:hypothetical protein